MTRNIRINLLALVIFCAGCAANGEGKNTVSAADDNLTTIERATQIEQQAIEPGLTTTQHISASQTNLPGILVNRLGVSQRQALGGAGAIFQVAKENMEPQAFATLSQSVPGMSAMLSAAPTLSNSVSTITGGISSVTGGADNTLTDVASLASSFEQLDLSPNMVSQFIPIVTNYVRANGGQAMANLLHSALR